MKRIHAVAIAWSALLVPGLAWSADLTGGIAGEAEYDSNVRRTGPLPQDDFIFRISPRVQLLEDEGKLTYDVRYRFPWEAAIKTDEVRGFRHFLAADGEYHFSDRTRLTLSDRFSQTDSVNSISSVDALGTPTLGTFRNPVNRNDFKLNLVHRFTPRVTTTTSFSHALFDTDLPGRANNQTFGLSLNNQFAYSPRHRFGGGISTSYQHFDRSNDRTRPPSNTIFATFFGSWSWLINETTTFEIAAGPTYIDTRQDAPPQVIDNAVAVPNFRIQNGSNDLFVFNDLLFCPTSAFPPQRELPRGGLCDVFVTVDLQAEEARDSRGFVQDISSEINEVRQDIDTIRAETVPTLGFQGPSIDISDQSWTIFAQASLTRRWSPTVVSTASYSRRDSTASGISGSAVLDLVSLITSWRINELWNATLRADFTKRESTGPVQEAFLRLDDGTINSNKLGPAGSNVLVSTLFQTVDNNDRLPYSSSFGSRISTRSVDTLRWGLAARVTRRITRHLSSSVRYTFNRQSSQQGTAGSFSDFNDHLVTLSVQYDFDRFHLW